MEVGQFTIKNIDEKSWGDYFLQRIIEVTSAKVILRNYHCTFYH